MVLGSISCPVWCSLSHAQHSSPTIAPSPPGICEAHTSHTWSEVIGPWRTLSLSLTVWLLHIPYSTPLTMWLGTFVALRWASILLNYTQKARYNFCSWIHRAVGSSQFLQCEFRVKEEADPFPWFQLSLPPMLSLPGFSWSSQGFLCLIWRRHGLSTSDSTSLYPTCYGLDKCPSKADMLKLWSPAHGALGRWWNLQEVGSGGRKLSLRTYWKGYRYLTPSCSPKAVSLTSHLHDNMLPCIEQLPRAMSQASMDRNLQNWVQIKFLPLRLIILGVFSTWKKNG